MVFADLAHSMNVPEAQFPSIMREFLQAVKAALPIDSAEVVFKNTWGDGLFIVFERVHAAAKFCLTLRDAIHARKFLDELHTQDFGIRIAGHVGPVIRLKDPVINRWNYYGANVGLSARVEPVVAVGRVFVTESFAAMLRAHADTGMHCRFLGNHRLAKNHSIEPLYALEWSTDQ